MNSLQFYINNYSYIDSEDEIDIEFVPKLQRRRLNKFARAAFTVLNKCYKDNITDIIFSSRYGELSQLKNLIGQYSQDNEVSPVLFSSSVYNSIIGQFAYLKKYSFSYSCQSGSKNTVSSSFVSSIISPCKNKLFCCCENDDSLKCLCVNLSSEKTANTKISCVVFKSEKNNLNIDDEFGILLKFLRGELNHVEFDGFRIERG